MRATITWALTALGLCCLSAAPAHAAAFVLGDMVKGGQYGEYPSRKPSDLTQGDLAPTLDFRGLYATILEDWLHVDAQPIVKGSFEQPRFL